MDGPGGWGCTWIWFGILEREGWQARAWSSNNSRFACMCDFSQSHRHRPIDLPIPPAGPSDFFFFCIIHYIKHPSMGTLKCVFIFCLSLSLSLPLSPRFRLVVRHVVVTRLRSPLCFCRLSHFFGSMLVTVFE